MDNELVTGSKSKATEGGGTTSRSPSTYSYAEVFDRECPYYMSIGMTYSEYWDGDNELPIFYRKAFEMKRDRENMMLWLQGEYVYEAILDATPVLNPMSKKHKPEPYRDHPIPLSKEQSDFQKEEENKQKLKNGKDAFLRMREGVNKKFKERG